MDRDELLRVPEAADEMHRAVRVPVRADPARVRRVAERADIVLAVWAVERCHKPDGSALVGRRWDRELDASDDGVSGGDVDQTRRDDLDVLAGGVLDAGDGD